METGRGLILGVLMLLGSIALLYWNEGRTIKSQVALGEEATSVDSVTDTSQVDAANDGKLVHVTGRATSEEVLSDAEFGISEQAIRLERQAEIFQWMGPSRNQSKGTTQSVPVDDGVPAFGPNRQFQIDRLYGKVWTLKPRPSEHFTYPEGHQNPPVTPFWKERQVWTAKQVRLGGYILPAALAGEIDREPIPATPVLLDRVPLEFRKHLQIREGRFYLAQDPSQSKQQVGDVRFGFRVIRPTVVSILARQSGKSFEPFTTSNGTQVFQLAMGEQTADSMFGIQHAESTVHTWGFRGFGFTLMFLGITLCLQGMDLWGLALPVGLALVATLCTIAAAWMPYRPVVAWSLLGIAAVGAAAGLVHLVISGRADNRTDSRSEESASESP
jgi:transmembrane protein TMEM43